MNDPMRLHFDQTPKHQYMNKIGSLMNEHSS